MERVLFQFHCTECSKYFNFKLNTSLDGNYRIHCPNCGHIHYRKLSNGEITDARFPQNDTSILIEDIRPMKSSCTDVLRDTENDLSRNVEGFMHRWWKEAKAVLQ